MSHAFEVLTKFAFESWLLGQAASDFSDSLVDGRIWERTVGDLLRCPQLIHHQGPGESTLFGYPPASGVRHELDACAADWNGNMILLECKSKKDGVTKADAALFHEKTLDFYCARLDDIGRQQWWRLIVSSVPIFDNAVRAFCIQLGLVLCEPGHLPLPMIVKIASRPIADMHLREILLQEIVRMGEPALRPMQDRWVHDPVTQDLRFRPKILKDASEIKDLLYLQEELGEDIFDLYKKYRPGSLERQINRMRNSLAKAAQ